MCPLSAHFHGFWASGDAEGFGGGPRSGNRRMERKYKNRGNELKESLKTKDITFDCGAKRTQI
jgi:hypothetical protein